MFGWQGWNWYQRNQAAQASGILAEVQKAASGHDAKTAAARAGVLIEKFPGTTHAVLAVLMSARLQAEGGDVKTAKAQLGWAAENAGELELRDIARLRLANLLLDEKAYDCLLYTSDAADERSSVDLGGRRIIKKKKNVTMRQ